MSSAVFQTVQIRQVKQRRLSASTEQRSLVIWDGAPIHRGQPVKDFLRRAAAKRLRLEQLPSYAPDLNPAEGIWTYLKRVELANTCCADLAKRGLALLHAKERLRHKRSVIQAWFAPAGYSA